MKFYWQMQLECMLLTKKKVFTNIFHEMITTDQNDIKKIRYNDKVKWINFKYIIYTKA